jgi:flagellar protein FlgJ
MTDLQKLNFLKKYYPLAVEAGKFFNINPVIILAQAAHEGAWGSSYGVRIRKNHFGITAGGSKNNYWNGAYSWNDKKTIRFRIYKTEKDSFFDFCRLISSSYKTAASVSFDYAKYAKAIAYSPYISEVNGDNRPNYERIIIINSKFILANIEGLKTNPSDSAYVLPAIGAGLLIAILKLLI